MGRKLFFGRKHVLDENNLWKIFFLTGKELLDWHFLWTKTSLWSICFLTAFVFELFWVIFLFTTKNVWPKFKQIDVRKKKNYDFFLQCFYFIREEEKNDEKNVLDK